MDKNDIKSLIARRRRQLLVHSIIYYRMDESLITDQKWAKWALELEELTKKYPNIAKSAPLANEFKDFDHSTGYNLPLETPWAVARACWLVQTHNDFSARGEKVYRDLMTSL